SVCPGDTSVLAGLYGPAEAKISKELPDRATLEVLLRPKVGLPGGDPLTCLCPKTGSSPQGRDIWFIYSSLFWFCWLLSCCLNAACMALLDAGLPLAALFCGVTCALQPDGTILLDPTARQEQEARAILTFAIASSNRKVLMATTKGSCSVEEMQQCLAAAQRAASTIFQFYRDSVRRRYSK
ncbi:EXOS5 protein, partial [Cardinalis cardinalis]|nr:EXOS5 protein [Cardinalis cardinalis]